MRIGWRRKAQADLRDIIDFITKDNPAAALRIGQTIRAQVRRLATQPNLGRPGRSGDTRELVITRTPYVVPYMVDRVHGRIVILRVLHRARQWPETFSGSS